MRSSGTGRGRLLLACVFALCGLGSLGASAVSAAPGYRLSFGSTAMTAESGGPLIVKGHRSGTGEPMVADQVIENTDGSKTTRPSIGQLVYEEYPDSLSHRHWHYKGFVRYQLRSVSDLSLVRPDNKAGFCMSDPALAPDFCGSLNPGALTVDEGLTPGVADYYNPLLEGQYIDVADVPPGDYWLVHWVNASKEICESSYANNAAGVKIALWPNGYGREPYLATKEVLEPFPPLYADLNPPANCDAASTPAPKLPDLAQRAPAELSVSVVGAGQTPPGTEQPVAPGPAAPALSARGARRYVVRALTRRFEKRPKKLRQACRRSSPTSFVCSVRWRDRRYRYKGTVRIITVRTQHRVRATGQSTSAAHSNQMPTRTPLLANDQGEEHALHDGRRLNRRPRGRRTISDGAGALRPSRISHRSGAPGRRQCHTRLPAAGGPAAPLRTSTRASVVSRIDRGSRNPPRHRTEPHRTLTKLDRYWTVETWLEMTTGPLKGLVCSPFVRVSDGTRTRDRLDHNQKPGASLGQIWLCRAKSLAEIGAVSLKLVPRLVPRCTYNYMIARIPLSGHDSAASRVGVGPGELRGRGDTRGGVAESALDELGLTFGRLVVGVDQGGLEVAVAHPLLQRPQRHPGRRHPRAEGVPQIVEAAHTARRAA